MLKKILLVIVSLLSLALLVAFAFFAYLQFADLNSYKPQITQRLSHYLSRSVIIDGNFDIKLIPLSISLTDTKIANAQWGSTPDMLRVHQLDLQLGMLALLSGELLIYKFVLDDVQVVVEHNEQGDNNWRIREPGEQQVNTTRESSSIPLDFASDVEVDIKDITFLYSQSPASPRHEFILNKAKLKGLSDVNALQIDVSGRIDGHVYEVKGQTGRLAELLSVKKSFPVDLQAHGLNAEWEIKGEIQNALKLEKIRLNAKASANDLTAWQEWLGVSIKQGPVNINADIDGDLKKLSVSNLAVQIGKSTANGDLALDMSAEKPNITAQLNIKDIPIKEFIDAIHGEPTTDSKAVAQQVKQEHLNQELDLGLLNLFDASVKLSVASVGYEAWIVDQFNAEFKVKDGQLSAAPFSIASQFGQANGKFSLVSERGVNVAKLDIDAKNLALGKFYDVASTYQGIGALQGSIYTNGKSLADLYANLQGNATGHYVNKEHKHDTKIALKRSSPKTSTAPFDVAIDGELQKVPYKITGEIGGPLALISDEPYPATAQLKFSNVDAKAKGTISELFEAKGFNIDVDARTKDLAKLNKTLDIGLPGLKKAQVRTVLRGDYSLLKFDNIKAKSNSARLSGNVHVDFKDDKPNIIGNLSIDKFDLTGIQKEIAHTKKAERGKGKKDAKGDKPALAETISFSALQDFNMNIKLKADNNDSITLPRFTITKLAAELSVANNTFSVSHLNIESPMGSVKSDFKINANDKEPVVEASLKGDELDLEPLEPDDVEQIFWDAIAGIDISLRAQGDSFQKWLESVAGAVTLNYQHKELSQIYAIRLAREEQPIEIDTPVSVQVNSKFKDTIALGYGNVGAPYTWTTDEKPTEINFKENFKGFVTEVRGKIDNIVTGDGMDIRVSFNNEQALAASLSQYDWVNRVGKVQVTSDIKGSYSSIAASQINGVVGEGRVKGSVAVNLREQPIALDVNLDIDGLDISKWAADEKPIKTIPKTKPETETDIESEADTEIDIAEGEKLFSSEELPFVLLKTVNIKGAINGNNIQFKRVKAKEVKATVNLKDGALQFNLSNLAAKDGSLNAKLNVDTKIAPPRVSLELNVPKINMSEFARNTVAEGLVTGYFGAEVSVSSAGKSMADLVAGMDGHVRLLVDKGSIDSRLFNVYTGGLRAMVGMLTVKKESATEINCGISGLKFENGKGVTEVALLDTKQSTLVAEGWVDFNNETFSFKASPVGKGLQLNVDLPVIIQGPFSDPKFSTQASSALYRAAEIATVWFIPSTAIFIGYDELRTSEKNPCVNMVAPSKDRAGMRAIKGAGKAFQDVGSAFNRSLSRLLGGGTEANPEDENTSETSE